MRTVNTSTGAMAVNYISWATNAGQDVKNVA
jgi:hypothetical protein